MFKNNSPPDTTQVATKMTKEAKDKAHGEQSSQQNFQFNQLKTVLTH